jgi:WhiB family redox-sensing transcriptional regulator
MAQEDAMTPEWMADALCRNHHNSLFFPVGRPSENSDGARAELRSKEEAAKTVCRRCPVAADCLHYAIVNSIPEGIWGANTPRERTAIARKWRSEAPTGHKLGYPVSYGTYKKHGCRCDGCRRAKANVQNANRSRAQNRKTA